MCIFFSMKTILYLTIQKQNKKSRIESVQLEELGRINFSEMQSICLAVRMKQPELEEINWEKVKNPLTKKLQRYLKKNVPEWQQDKEEVFFWFEPRVAEYFDRYPKEYPEEFLQYICKTLPFTDTVIIREGSVEEVCALIRQVYGHCNKLILCRKEEQGSESYELEVLSDEIYEETGLLIERVEKIPIPMTLDKDKWKKGYPPVLFDLSQKGENLYRKIPQNTIYIDLKPTKRKRRAITEKRKDITYRTYANYLDTTKASEL